MVSKKVLPIFLAFCISATGAFNICFAGNKGIFSFLCKKKEVKKNLITEKIKKVGIWTAVGIVGLVTIFLVVNKIRDSIDDSDQYIPDDNPNPSNFNDFVTINELEQNYDRKNDNKLGKLDENLDPNEEKDCAICWEKHKRSEFVKLPCCGHELCIKQLQEWIENTIKDKEEGKDTNLLKCPNSGCEKNRPMISRRILEYAIGKAEIDKKQELIKIFDMRRKTISKVLGLNKYKECPMPGCEEYFINKDKTPHRMTCKGCKKSYCNQCLHSHVEGRPCFTSDDQKEYDKWVKKNTKQCPMCHRAIEKNNGCNHINCPCGCQFCWNCGFHVMSAPGMDNGVAWVLSGHDSYCRFVGPKFFLRFCDKIADKINGGINMIGINMVVQQHNLNIQPVRRPFARFRRPAPRNNPVF